MVKIEETIVQDGPLFSKGYKAVLSEGKTAKDEVRYHIDSEVGDIYDLVADLSKMVWILDRQLNNEALPSDEEDKLKLKSRTEKVADILTNYYNKG